LNAFFWSFIGVWKRWSNYIFNMKREALPRFIENVLRSTLPRFIENVLRSTLSYPNETSKEYIQFLILWHSSPLHLIYFLVFHFPQKIPRPFFYNECPQRKTLSDGWINSLFFILFITYTVVIHMMYNRVLYIWSWFFPVTVLYTILILPRHCLIYDPDSSPSLSYIWFWFFPVTVFYMILILPRQYQITPI
jgi:hypothetical protein